MRVLNGQINFLGGTEDCWAPINPTAVLLFPIKNQVVVQGWANYKQAS